MRGIAFGINRDQSGSIGSDPSGSNRINPDPIGSINRYQSGSINRDQSGSIGINQSDSNHSESNQSESIGINRDESINRDQSRSIEMLVRPVDSLSFSNSSFSCLKSFWIFVISGKWAFSSSFLSMSSCFAQRCGGRVGTKTLWSVTFEVGQVRRCDIWPACTKVSHSNSDKSADATWGVERGFFPRTVLGRIEAEFPKKCAFFRKFPKKKIQKKFKKKNQKKFKKKINFFSIFFYFFFWKIQKMYAWEMTKNQRSGLSDKATRFQKWPEDGNISGYALFLSSRENRRFYTKCSFTFWILLFFEEKYKAFFVISREAKKQMIFFGEMTSSSIVPQLTYILLIVSIGGRLDRSSKWRISRGEWAARNRPSIVPEIQGRRRDDSIAL